MKFSGIHPKKQETERPAAAKLSDATLADATLAPAILAFWNYGLTMTGKENTLYVRIVFGEDVVATVSEQIDSPI
jgi:hypothetical protein